MAYPFLLVVIVLVINQQDTPLFQIAPYTRNKHSSRPMHARGQGIERTGIVEQVTDELFDGLLVFGQAAGGPQRQQLGAQARVGSAPAGQLVEQRARGGRGFGEDRKSTRLNSSH